MATSTVKEERPETDLKDMQDRRIELRFGSNQAVVVSVLAPKPVRDIRGTIVEASKSGLRLTLGTAVENGAVIEVKWGGATMVGEARYCRQIGPNRYGVGVKISRVAGQAKLQTQSGVA